MVAYYCQTICIIAGTGSAECSIPVRRVVLERSSVLQGWIRYPDTMPESVRRGADIYLGSCDPDVVREVFRFLGDEYSGRLVPAEDATMEESRDTLFWVRMYKLAMLLAIDSAVAFAVNNLSQCHITSRCTPEAFIRTLLIAGNEHENLLDDNNIRNWMVSYISHNLETFGFSSALEQLILSGSLETWGIICLLMTTVVRLGEETKSARKDLEEIKKELKGKGRGTLMTPQSSPARARGQ